MTFRQRKLYGGGKAFVNDNSSRREKYLVTGKVRPLFKGVSTLQAGNEMAAFSGSVGQDFHRQR
jgi:hypothetical protein